MITSHSKIANILKAPPEVILDLDQRLATISGKSGVVEQLATDIDQKITKRLTELGLSRGSDYQAVYDGLYAGLIALEKKLLTQLGTSDLGTITQAALQLENPGTGYFIKPAKAIEMLKLNPPQVILGYLGITSVEELVKQEGLSAVYSALRFTESSDWMNKIFIKSYATLQPEDFEERPVELLVLDPKWLKVADRFLKKKYHNVSHLKELGVIFVIPLPIDTDGELLRVFTLLLHYLNEVPFYSGLFRKFATAPNFADKVMSLLRGDVPSGALNNNFQPNPDIVNAELSQRQLEQSNPGTSVAQRAVNLGTGALNIRVIQRYLAKDDKKDFRLFEPHFNPEAEHWYKAQASLAKLAGFQEVIEYDYVGDFFSDKLISFDLIDSIMSLVKKEDDKYLYHQEEALWNKFFIEHLGRERLDQLVADNIIRGIITL